VCAGHHQHHTPGWVTGLRQGAAFPGGLGKRYRGVPVCVGGWGVVVVQVGLLLRAMPAAGCSGCSPHCRAHCSQRVRHRLPNCVRCRALPEDLLLIKCALLAPTSAHCTSLACGIKDVHHTALLPALPDHSSLSSKPFSPPPLLPCTGALLQLLQPSKAPTGAAATGAAASAATPAGGPGGGGRRALSSSERAALEQLQSYFSALVEELAGAVGALALADFNGWLVGGAGAGEWCGAGGKVSHWYMLKSEVGTMAPCVSQPAAA
jgi:hypothetical protein